LDLHTDGLENNSPIVPYDWALLCRGVKEKKRFVAQGQNKDDFFDADISALFSIVVSLTVLLRFIEPRAAVKQPDFKLPHVFTHFLFVLLH